MHVCVTVLSVVTTHHESMSFSRPPPVALVLTAIALTQIYDTCTWGENGKMRWHMDGGGYEAAIQPPSWYDTYTHTTVAMRSRHTTLCSYPLRMHMS